ncbi:sulfite exporter TauE/SafE family protein [Runella slithyformis]|uniref:Integral membrane protein n=1 Tax=Runella slithyformis (strain ATCC 29530 / DSM 19594 / LMG 11500 / NCIMB 11436 / LSU 4) TaxID=761193 RepID=A0A7U3ZQJ6_RUNSL|nr:sulfite exporter TauE/SafE family protein [Runella slithyformis]AEI51550.1 integral membrane protein [Runella slithyformis DSM 19594]
MLYLAFTLGLMSSLHCVGMCGPIALALPVHHRSTFGKLLGILMYNAGRATTYSLLGVLFGLVGSALDFGGIQRGLSIGTGIILLGTVAYSSHWIDQLSAPLPLQKGVQWVKKRLGLLLSRRSFPALFLLGTLNGLLPCGLVYMALISSIAMGNPWEGGLFMALFGAGTLPAMSAVAFVKTFISTKFRNQARRLMPAFVAVVAILLIVRGFQFSESPSGAKTARPIPVCHGE